MSDEEVQVNPRCKWEHEAWDFTPWLADHLDQLGKAIGLNLELIQTDYQVGSFSLDILAWESNEKVRVAIENQLEWTDHGHLGQLLTYSAGCGARIAIWVAAEFQYEHAEALHNLNKWVGKDIRFYGVRVAAIRSPSSDSLEPRLEKVVYPWGWNKERTLPQPPPVNPEIQKYKDFFGPLIAKVIDSGLAGSYRQAWTHEDRLLPSGFDEHIGYGVSLDDRNGAWVYLHIRTWDSVDISNNLFDKLMKDKAGIESSVGAEGEWRWDKYEPRSFATIGVSKSGTIDDSPGELEKTKAWMLDLLPKFKDIFEERTKTLLAELRG